MIEKTNEVSTQHGIVRSAMRNAGEEEEEEEDNDATGSEEEDADEEEEEDDEPRHGTAAQWPQLEEEAEEEEDDDGDEDEDGGSDTGGSVVQGQDGRDRCYEERSFMLSRKHAKKCDEDNGQSILKIISSQYRGFENSEKERSQVKDFVLDLKIAKK